jgi:hypothetical protein
MNGKLTAIFFTAMIAGTFPTLCRGQTVVPDLKNVPEGKGWKGSIDSARPAIKDSERAVEFNNPGQNVVWMEGFDFKEGTLEFDAKGKSAPPQSSFVGISFRVVDAKTFDAVYFRPFNFRSADPERKSHAVQYISEPAWPWQKLRQERPGQFEKAIDPAPDGDGWFHVKITVESKQVKVFVNNAASPSLVVNELSERTGGSVGLWCNGYGVVANLKISVRK